MPRKTKDTQTYNQPGDELGPKIVRADDVSTPVKDGLSEAGKPLLSLVESLPPSIQKRDEVVKITVMKDHLLTFPDLFLDIFVVGPLWEERAFAGLFARSRCKKAKSLLEADLVIFTGGEDVDPALYDEERHPTTATSRKRDSDDMGVYVQCIEHGIPMLGICRGAQFLHVMNGGKLYQHVDNHHGDHFMYDIKHRTRLERISSVHHQMVIPQNQNGFQLLATANIARNRWRNPKENDIGTKIDVEAFFYRDTCAIGIQGHPEYRGYNQFAKWTLDLINDLVIMNPDVEWRGKARRLKEEFIAERDARAKAMPSSALL